MMTNARAVKSVVLFYPFESDTVQEYDSRSSALWCIRENNPVRKLRCKRLGPSYHMTWEVWGESLNTGICYFLGVMDESQV